jgi:hypothetical protein
MESKFAPQFNRVKGVSDRRRLPRLDKIRLGVKKKGKKNNKEYEYPAEVDFFVCPKEVMKVYGEEPKELEIMFPINDLGVIFPQAYTMYGQTRGVKCKGNGEIAMRLNEDTGAWIERECPCEFLDQKKCSLRGHLQFMLPKVNAGGVYQLDTGSFNSTVDVNSGLDYIAEMVGRFNMIPLTLKRIQRETHADGKKQKHYTLHVHLDATLIEVNLIKENPDKIFQRNTEGQLVPVIGSRAQANYSLPEPIDENPALDPGATIVIEKEEEKKEEAKPPEKESVTGKDEAIAKKTKEKALKDLEKKPKEDDKLPPGSHVDIVDMKGFQALDKKERIRTITGVCQALNINIPSPAPLEDHSLRELSDVYDYILRTHGDQLQTKK